MPHDHLDFSAQRATHNVAGGQEPGITALTNRRQAQGVKKQDQ